MIQTKPQRTRGVPVRSSSLDLVDDESFQASLTGRERELIALIAEGLQNKVIAYRLQISPNTVRAHIGNIMKKYNLHNRTQIAMTLTAMIDHKQTGRRYMCADSPGLTPDDVDDLPHETWSSAIDPRSTI